MNKLFDKEQRDLFDIYDYIDKDKYVDYILFNKCREKIISEYNNYIKNKKKIISKGGD